MTVRRATSRAASIAANLLVRVLVRLRPQRWLSPWVTLPLLRFSSRAGSARLAAGVRSHQPTRTWTTRTDLSYGPAGRDGRFDLVLPPGEGPHPWLLWVHGGGWYLGSKSDPLPYVELLASHGFAGVCVNYPRAPRWRYPAAPRAVNQALAHLVENATDYGLDPGRVVIAGDSAGAQVAAEVANLVTNPAYAARTGLTPALDPVQLRGVLLFCGIFDIGALNDSDRYFEAALESALWSLTRQRAWSQSQAADLMDVRSNLGPAFPPTFLAAGNADPLTRRQLPAMAARLRELGVRLSEFTPGSQQELVGHEFQFHLASPAGAEALDRTTLFLTEVLS